MLDYKAVGILKSGESNVSIGYSTAEVDKQVHSTTLYHCRQCSIIFEQRLDHFRSNCAQKLYSCKIRGSYVLNLVNIGPRITSHCCPQTPDGRTDVILYSVQCICIALDRQKQAHVCVSFSVNFQCHFMPGLNTGLPTNTAPRVRKFGTPTFWTKVAAFKLFTRTNKLENCDRPRNMDIHCRVYCCCRTRRVDVRSTWAAA